MGYKYNQKDVDKIRGLFFRTELRTDEDVIDNKSQTISDETGIHLRSVDKIIDLEILKLNNSR